MISAALSTSIPRFRRTSARKSRLACDPLTSNTRFFLMGSGIGAVEFKAGKGVFMPMLSLTRGLRLAVIWVGLHLALAARECAACERSSVCVPGDISTCRHCVRTYELLSFGLVRKPVIYPLRPSAYCLVDIQSNSVKSV